MDVLQQQSRVLYISHVQCGQQILKGTHGKTEDFFNEMVCDRFNYFHDKQPKSIRYTISVQEAKSSDISGKIFF